MILAHPTRRLCARPAVAVAVAMGLALLPGQAAAQTPPQMNKSPGQIGQMNHMGQTGAQGETTAVPGAEADAGTSPAAPSAALVSKGKEIATTVAGIGCTGCHGVYGEGDVGIGPYIRGVDLAKVQATIAGVNQMAFLKEELTAEDAEAVSAYFSWLGSLQLVKTLVKRGRILPQSAEVRPGTGVQLVISNANTRPFTFAAKGLGLPEITVDAREEREIVIAAPEKDGAYEIVCLDCQPKNQHFTLMVTGAAEPLKVPEASAAYATLLPEMAANAAPKPPAGAAAAEPTRAELIARGRDIFLHVADVGCVACHGPYAEGDVGIGPFNRGMDETAIRAALQKVEAMQFLRGDLTESGIKEIAAYYQRMGELRLIKTHQVKGRFFPDHIEVAPGEEIQLVVVNRDHALATVNAPAMGIEPYTLPAEGQDDRIWKAPQSPGSFEMRCVDCAQTAPGLTINVTGS